MINNAIFKYLTLGTLAGIRTTDRLLKNAKALIPSPRLQGK
jgi:hypothetical protein